MGGTNRIISIGKNPNEKSDEDSIKCVKKKLNMNNGVIGNGGNEILIADDEDYERHDLNPDD
jgi:hypothetical protein